MKKLLCWFGIVLTLVTVLSAVAYFFFKEKPEYCPACLKKVTNGILG